MSDALKRLDITVQRQVDACGLSCPLPILRARKALSEMSSGELLLVRATDAGSKNDFASFARQTGNVLLEQGEDEAGVYWFLLRRR